MGDGCCQIPNDTITGKCSLWLSRVSPACARPAFPVCKKLAGGVECLTEGLSFDARIVSFYRSLVPVRNEALSWGWNCRFDSLSECDLKNGWEYSGKQIPLFCWWVRGKRISLPLWKWKNWVKKSMLCEKFGDYCLDLSKLIFGGVILAAIMQLDRDIYWIFLR